MGSKTTLKVVIQSIGVFIVGQVLSIGAGVLWVIISSDNSFGAGLSGILVYLAVSVPCFIIGAGIVIALNRDRILTAVITNIFLLMVYSFLIVFFFLGNPLSGNDVADRDATERGETTVTEYESNTGFELPEEYSNLELECESGLDYACTLSFEMPEDAVNDYIKQFGFENGINDLAEYDSEGLKKQYIINDAWNFDGYSIFLKGETALKEVINGVEYAGIGTKIIIAYESADSTQAKIFLFHLD